MKNNFAFGRVLCRAVLLFCALGAGALPPASAVDAAPSATVAAERAFTRGDPVPAWVDRVSTIPPAPSGHALTIRLADLQFYAAPRQVTYQHRALSAHEVSSLGALGQFDIEFQPDYQRVQLHSLVVMRGAHSRKSFGLAIKAASDALVMVIGHKWPVSSCDVR